VVYLQELNPPAGDEPVDWMLLTSEPVTSLPEALVIVEHYRVRWTIEVFHPYCLQCHTFDKSFGQGLGRVRSAA